MLHAPTVGPVVADLTVGDIAVTVLAMTMTVYDPLPETHVLYRVAFRDTLTGSIAVIRAEGENDALMLFAAWIVSDESNIGVLEAYRKRLAASLPSGFLP